MDSGLNLGDNPDNSGYAWINFTQRLCYYKYASVAIFGNCTRLFSHGISGQLQRCWWPSPLGRHGRRRRCAVALESTCLAVFFYTLRAIHDSPFILVGLLVSNCDGVRVNRAIYWVWRMLFVCRKKESMSSPLTKQAQNRENFYEEKVHFHRFLSGCRILCQITHNWRENLHYRTTGNSNKTNPITLILSDRAQGRKRNVSDVVTVRQDKDIDVLDKNACC